MTLDEVYTLLGCTWERYSLLKKLDEKHRWKANPEIIILEKELKKLRAESNKKEKKK